MVFYYILATSHINKLVYINKVLTYLTYLVLHIINAQKKRKDFAFFLAPLDLRNYPTLRLISKNNVVKSI